MIQRIKRVSVGSTIGAVLVGTTCRPMMRVFGSCWTSCITKGHRIRIIKEIYDYGT
ncbi:unnamed protein product [Brassica oleracea]|uniref:Uncharacterized protein n=2 Tax=Brassica TaxID=3705 RepID=A0A3P6BVC2_BRAOL|nr:unnamed protein product [Brassica napus]VDD10157.1 unnamed protein product [Brassica oleracea]